MNNRTLGILAAIFVLLGVIAMEPYWSPYFNWQTLLNQRSDTQVRIPSEIERITFVRGEDNEISLIRQGADWLVEDHLVDPDRMTQLLSDLNQIEFTDVVSTNPQNFINYGASDSANLVRLTSPDETELEIYIGIPGVQPNTVYLRPVGVEAVYQVRSDLLSFASQNVAQWRDKTLLDIAEADLTEVILEDSRRRVEVRPGNEDQWLATLGEDSRIIGEVALERFFQALNPLVAVAFADDAETELFSNSAQRTIITFVLEDESEVQLTLVENAEVNNWLVQPDDSEEVLILTQDQVNALVDNTLSIFD